MNKENDEKIGEVLADVFKKIGRKILAGKFCDLTKISKPIQLCHHFSFLEALA